MSFSIAEYDVWPRVRDAAEEELTRRIHGLRTVQPDELKRQQAWCEALEWVLEEGKPKPLPKQEVEEV